MPRYLAFYGAVFAAFGAASPFLPALLQSYGLSPASLGVALGFGTAIRLVTGPLGGRLADRASRPRWVLAGFVAASAVIATAYLPVRGILLLTAASVAHAAVLAPITPVADALAVQAAKGARFQYGWVRGAGSAAFVAATLLSGQAVGRWGLVAIIPLNAGLLAAAAVFAATLPDGQARASGRLAEARAPLTALFRIPGFVSLMVVIALIGGSHAMHDGFEVIRWRAAGMTPGATSVLWSASVLSEVFVFVVIGPPLLGRLGPAAALSLSAAAGLVRWGAAALTASFPVMALVEPLHGLTFALAHLACVTAIARLVPSGMAATAQAFYATVALGITGAAVTLASGPLYGRLGARAFWAMALLCAIALPLAWRLRVSGPSAASRTAEAPPPRPGSS